MDAKDPDRRLAAIVKAYDLRGRAPQEFDAELAHVLGAAFAMETAISHGRGRALVGRDMRTTSDELAEALIGGIRSVGAGVIDLGLASTDLLYCAAGTMELPGAMVTASHNPASDNGLKLCRAGAKPIGLDSGLAAIRDTAASLLRQNLSGQNMRVLGGPDGSGERAAIGSYQRADFLDEYARTLVALVPVGGRRLRVAVDAANAMAGLTVPAVFAHLDVDLVELYFDLDGSFPNHLANPLDAQTLVDLQAAVRTHNCDLGLAFDGDADRCFVVDQAGALVSPSAITALIAQRYLASAPGATILYNLISSRSVPEAIAAHGGRGVRTGVGHSLIKAEMAATGAVFGGEHSGHYYFGDFHCADSGMLAALHVLAILAGSEHSLSDVVSPFNRYVASGEINRVVDDCAATTELLAGEFDCYLQDRLDGLTVRSAAWWFNLRASNTEPLLRLNVEATTPEQMAEIRDRVLATIDRSKTSAEAQIRLLP